MSTLSWLSRVPLLACLLACVNAHAQTVLFNKVHTIAAATQAVPVEETLTITTAGNYQVTLVDLGSQISAGAALTAVELAITSGNTVVGTPLTAAGSAQFAATPGTYIIHVVGIPAMTTDTGGNTVTTPYSGLIGIQITNVANNTQVAAFSDTLAFPPSSTGSVNNVGVVNDTFTVSTADNFQVSLSDLQLPQALGQLTMAIAVQGGSIVTNSVLATAPGSPTATSTVALQPGTYRIVAAGQGGVVNAGLYSVTLTSGSGAGTIAYSNTTPVGTVASVGSVNLNAGGSYTLGLNDLSYPQPLSALAGAVTLNGQIAAELTAAGTSQPFASVSGAYQVFALATAAPAVAATATAPAVPAAGSYTLALSPQSGAPALSTARAVTAGGTTDPTPYGFDTNLTTAGVYAFNLGDFAFPTQFVSIGAIAVQSGALLGQPLKLAGTQNVTAAAGPVTLLVFAQPGASGSLFDVNLTASGASPVFDQTQGVGQLFTAQQVAVTTAGAYAVNVADVGFPAPLKTFAVIVTRGTTQVGSAYGSGQIPFTAAAAGNYFINFIAQPAAAAQSTGSALTMASFQAGTYSLNVGTAPVVNLTSDVSSVTSGGVAHLSWTTVNASNCAASGGWTGDQMPNGTATTAALTADTTFTLTCTGAGATGTGTVTVKSTAATTPPPASGGGGHGGGGALTVDLLLALLAATALRGTARRST
ncbi:MAG: hypothetical protein JWL65_4130 [Gammaproteobacteria bacterium]|nr:hypothetical protein [Gammaproteobacteria bacterium]